MRPSNHPTLASEVRAIHGGINWLRSAGGTSDHSQNKDMTVVCANSQFDLWNLLEPEYWQTDFKSAPK
jgi:hypothetical protein